MTSRPPRGTRGETKRHLSLAPVGKTKVTSSLDRHPTDGWQLAHPYPLGPRALRVLRLLVDTLCPSAASRAPRSPELDERVFLGARRFLSYMHPTVSRGLAFGLVLLDFLPVLTLRARHTLHGSSRSEVTRLFSEWVTSRFTALRLLATGLRSLVLSVYFDQEEVHRALHYAPVPFMKDRILFRAKLLGPTVPIAAE
ncbi:MAG TPA: hypothetical protein VF395_19160 [Polyangiaceae bacterium]